MKHFYFILFISLLFSCNSSTKQKDKLSVIETILIDPDQSVKELNISPLLEDSFDIIKLEMTKNSLIADIDKIEITNNNIFISDKINSKIFVFDRYGKYIKTIGQKGGGPGEFSYLGDFDVNENSVYVQDAYGHKYIVYAINDNSYKEISYIPHHLALLTFNKILYLVSNYFTSDLGYYNLYRVDLKTGETKGYLPFDKNLVERYSKSALNHYVSRYEDGALLIYPRNDTVYSVTKDWVEPRYIISFTKRSIPKDFGEEKDMSVGSALEKGYLSGIEYLQNSADYLWGVYTDKKRYRYLLINKETLKYEIGEKLILKNLGNLMIHSYIITDKNELIVTMPSYILKNNWESYYQKNIFKNERNKEKIKKTILKLQEEDNPIIFKFKIKTEP